MDNVSRKRSGSVENKQPTQSQKQSKLRDSFKWNGKDVEFKSKDIGFKAYIDSNLGRRIKSALLPITNYLFGNWSETIRPKTMAERKVEYLKQLESKFSKSDSEIDKAIAVVAGKKLKESIDVTSDVTARDVFDQYGAQHLGMKVSDFHALKDKELTANYLMDMIDAAEGYKYKDKDSKELGIVLLKAYLMDDNSDKSVSGFKAFLENPIPEDFKFGKEIGFLVFDDYWGDPDGSGQSLSGFNELLKDTDELKKVLKNALELDVDKGVELLRSIDKCEDKDAKKALFNAIGGEKCTKFSRALKHFVVQWIYAGQLDLAEKAINKFEEGGGKDEIYRQLAEKYYKSDNFENAEEIIGKINSGDEKKETLKNYINYLINDKGKGSLERAKDLLIKEGLEKNLVKAAREELMVSLKQDIENNKITKEKLSLLVSLDGLDIVPKTDLDDEAIQNYFWTKFLAAAKNKESVELTKFYLGVYQHLSKEKDAVIIKKGLGEDVTLAEKFRSLFKDNYFTINEYLNDVKQNDAMQSLKALRMDDKYLENESLSNSLNELTKLTNVVKNSYSGEGVLLKKQVIECFEKIWDANANDEKIWKQCAENLAKLDSGSNFIKTKIESLKKEEGTSKLDRIEYLANLLYNPLNDRSRKDNPYIYLFAEYYKDDNTRDKAIQILSDRKAYAPLVTFNDQYKLFEGLKNKSDKNFEQNINNLLILANNIDPENKDFANTNKQELKKMLIQESVKDPKFAVRISGFSELIQDINAKKIEFGFELFCALFFAYSQQWTPNKDTETALKNLTEKQESYKDKFMDYIDLESSMYGTGDESNKPRLEGKKLTNIKTYYKKFFGSDYGTDLKERKNSR